jgi:hypothetical protein
MWLNLFHEILESCDSGSEGGIPVNRVARWGRFVYLGVRPSTPTGRVTPSNGVMVLFRSDKHSSPPPNYSSIHIPNMSITSVQNKVVIVTGCSSGIGLATARLFLERKALVFGIDVGSIPQKLADEHETFTFHQANLTGSRAVDEAVSRCHQQHGRVDVLVNCAGISDGWSSADNLHEDEWERVMAINLTVPIRLMKAVLPFMKEQKDGSIVNVASKAGTSGASAGIAYTASKHGLVRLIY